MSSYFLRGPVLSGSGYFMSVLVLVPLVPHHICCLPTRKGKNGQKMQALAVFTAAKAVMARKRKDGRENDDMVYIGMKFCVNADQVNRKANQAGNNWLTKKIGRPASSSRGLFW